METTRYICDKNGDVVLNISGLLHLNPSFLCSSELLTDASPFLKSLIDGNKGHARTEEGHLIIEHESEISSREIYEKVLDVIHQRPEVKRPRPSQLSDAAAVVHKYQCHDAMAPVVEKWLEKPATTLVEWRGDTAMAAFPMAMVSVAWAFRSKQHFQIATKDALVAMGRRIDHGKYPLPENIIDRLNEKWDGLMGGAIPFLNRVQRHLHEVQDGIIHPDLRDAAIQKLREYGFYYPPNDRVPKSANYSDLQVCASQYMTLFRGSIDKCHCGSNNQCDLVPLRGNLPLDVRDLEGLTMEEFLGGQEGSE